MHRHPQSIRYWIYYVTCYKNTIQYINSYTYKRLHFLISTDRRETRKYAEVGDRLVGADRLIYSASIGDGVDTEQVWWSRTICRSRLAAFGELGSSTGPGKCGSVHGEPGLRGPRGPWRWEQIPWRGKREATPESSHFVRPWGRRWRTCARTGHRTRRDYGRADRSPWDRK